MLHVTYLPKFWEYGNFGGYGVEPHQNQIMVKIMYGNVVFFYLCHFLWKNERKNRVNLVVKYAVILRMLIK